MRVVVIGGTTFIGPHVVRALAAAHHDVTVYHRGQHEAHLPPSVRHVRHPDAGIPVVSFGPELLDPPPDVVVHMVAMGSRDAAAFVRAFAGVAGRAVVVSSGDVYRAYGLLYRTEPPPPDSTHAPLTEDADLRASRYPYRRLASDPGEWIYHYEKILVEHLCREDARLPVTILRLPAVYGPHDPTRRLFPYVKRMDDRRPAILLDQAKAAWRFTHDFVENVGAAIALAAMDPRAAGRTYNVGPLATPTLREWVEAIGRAAAWNGRIVTLPREQLPRHLREEADFRHDVVLDSSRIRAELGYRDVVPLEEALRRTVGWDRAVPPERIAESQFDYAAEDAALAATAGAAGATAAGDAR